MSGPDSDAGPDLSAGVDAGLVPEGGLLAGRAAEDEVVVARSGGRLYAVSARCTHLRAPLAKGLVVGAQVRCPWHHARFDLATGEAVGAPAFDPLGCFAVEERDGRIRVTGRKAQTAKSEPRSEPPRRVLIVGGGAAGHACAEMLARHGFGGRVTVVSDDADAPYDRTFCSKQYLSGKAPREATALAHEGFWSPGGPVLRSGARVADLGVEAREAVLEDGGRIGWDALVLATGAEPQRPDMPGFDRPNVYVLRTLADADALIAACQGARRVAVLGSSFIGLEAAAALIARKLAVTLVAPEPVPLAKVVGEAVGGFVHAVHAAHGVDFRLGRKAAAYDGRVLVLDDGSQVEADVVVLGLGVAPRVELAARAGLRLHAASGGVEVDHRLRASAPGVFAIGDIAAWPGPTGERVRVEHWVLAQRQGQHVARTLMGEDAPFVETPFFWSTHYDKSLRYAGHAEDIGSMRIEGDVAAGDFAASLEEGGRDAALVTAGRDVAALRWEAAQAPSPSAAADGGTGSLG